MSIEIQVKATVEIPQVPKFLKMNDGQTIPISAITEEGLREIGEAWTLELINAAAKQRTDPIEAAMPIPFATGGRR